MEKHNRRILSVFLPEWPVEHLCLGAAQASANKASVMRKGRRSSTATGPNGSTPNGSTGAILGLLRLVEWCGRYTPQAAPDLPDGIILDVTSSSRHFPGGEEELAADIERRLLSLGVKSRIAVAGNAAAAWSLARFGTSTPLLVRGGETHALCAGLPLAALRLPPLVLKGFERLGLSRIGELASIPYSMLVRRCGYDAAQRLAQMQDLGTGACMGGGAPMQAAPDRRSRYRLAQPTVDPGELGRGLRHISTEIWWRLAREGVRASRLTLGCYRIDGEVVLLTASPRKGQDVDQAVRLFGEKLAMIDPGPGIDELVLDVLAAEPIFQGDARAERAQVQPNRLQTSMSRVPSGLTPRSGTVLPFPGNPAQFFQ